VMSTVLSGQVTSAEPRVLGQRGLAAGDSFVQRIENGLTRALTAAWNPLLQTGAIANVSLLLAVLSGCLILFWYVPSVHQAHSSLAEMARSPWTAGLLRSVHRYSSDACMLFVLIHAVKIVLARRFTGARWFAWVTGLVGLFLLWLVGWLGYWLVWDQRAQQVALGSAKLLDVLPVFAEPFSRAFLADGLVPSLLFFVVFFAHMLLPVALGVALWLHIARLQRARFLPCRSMSVAVVIVTIAVSLLWPATSAPPAAMATVPAAFTMDWWYLAPLVVIERLPGGTLWLAALVVTAAAMSVPRWMRKGSFRAASVEISRCNSCQTCAKDCPYGAITMVPRSDGKDLPFQAQVDPARCVGCGICSGSCDSVGIGLPWLSVVDERILYDRWLEQAPGARLVLACTHSAAGSWTVDSETGSCPQAPDSRVAKVPCAGWVHALTIERALRHGAREVVVVACGEGNCRYREGGGTVLERIDGRRKPSLRTDKADRARVRVLDFGAGEAKALAACMAESDGRVAKPGRGKQLVIAALLVAGLSVLTYFASDATYAPPSTGESELVVSFKHPGAITGTTRMLSDAEKQALPVHMRAQQVTERRRSPVRLVVRIDGEELLRKAYPPSGLWGDGHSVAIERFCVPSGAHKVEVAIGDGADPSVFEHRQDSELAFRARERRVLVFERPEGFRWY